MWLVDTSIWIEHFRVGRPDLADRLSRGLVLMHPCVSGELACGNLRERKALLRDLDRLPSATLATNSEARHLLEDRRIWGRGLGWVDVHLLASALLSHCRFWTLDKTLEQVAGDLEIR